LESFLGAFYWILMLFYSPLLAFISLFLAMLNIIALQSISKKREESYSRLQQAEGKLQGITTNGIQLIETLKARGGEDDFFQKWAGYQAKTLRAEQDLGQLSLRLDLIPPFLQAINTLIILSVGAWLVMDGFMTIGMLVAFQSFAQSFAEPVQHWVSLGAKLQEAKGDIQRLHDVLQAPIDPQTKSNFVFTEEKPNFNIITKKLQGYIEFKNVTFKYGEGPVILDNFI
jgi:ABC-type bacteriocin/lantibiotic exporter with double-glycine peptidase domain